MSFSLDIKNFIEKFGKNADQVVRKTVMDIATSLIEKSPVGNPLLWVSLNPYTSLMTKTGKTRIRPKLMTKYAPPPGYSGGHFRANWQLGIGSIPDGEIDEKDKGVRKTQARIRAAIPNDAAGKVYYIVNNLPYAQRLEDGWSTQAPFGMVGLTVIEFNDIVAKALAELK